MGTYKHGHNRIQMNKIGPTTHVESLRAVAWTGDRNLGSCEEYDPKGVHGKNVIPWGVHGKNVIPARGLITLDFSPWMNMIPGILRLTIENPVIWPPKYTYSRSFSRSKEVGTVEAGLLWGSRSSHGLLRGRTWSRKESMGRTWSLEKPMERTWSPGSYSSHDPKSL